MVAAAIALVSLAFVHVARLPRGPVPLRAPIPALSAADRLEPPSTSMENGDEIRLITPLQPRHFADYARGELTPERIRCANCSCGYSERCYALCNSYKAVRLGKTSKWDTGKVGMYFGLWYLLSVGFSVANKQVTNTINLPWLVSAMQLAVGTLFCLTLWGTGLRDRPEISRDSLRALVPIGCFHAVGHITGVIATAAGAVSFVQVSSFAPPRRAAAHVLATPPLHSFALP